MVKISPDEARGYPAEVWDDELSALADLCDGADEISRGFFRQDPEVRIKADQTPVTAADLAIEEYLRGELARRFPGDAVLGEEFGADGDAERTWVIDPIDGTKNFAAGIPVFATLIALQVNGRSVAGAMSAPMLAERYLAADDRGATRNGEPIAVSSRATVADAMIVCGDIEVWLGGPLEKPLTGLLASARRQRGFGDFWGHGLVASGAADVMLEPVLRVWDYAAPACIVEEAGGRITQLDGSPLADNGSAISTNGAVHDEVLASLRVSDEVSAR